MSYIPQKDSMKFFPSKNRAEEFIRTNGGHLIEVPICNSEELAKEWIKENVLDRDRDMWSVIPTPYIKPLDSDGEPIEKGTQRNPREFVGRAASKMYCVELDR